MTATLGQQILAANKPKVEAVDLGEFTVYVHALTVLEASAFHIAMQQGKKDGTLTDAGTTGLLAVHSIRDEHGARIFNDDQVNELLGIAGAAFQPALSVVLRLNNVGSTAEKK